MRRTQHLQKNRFGVYCFRYTFPKAFTQKYPLQPKTIHLSLKTRNKAIAIKRVQMLWLEVHRLMEQNWSDDRSDEQKIGEILRHYRRWMESDEAWDRPYTSFNPNEYASEDQCVEAQLWEIQRAELLGFLDEDNLSNKDELYQKALLKQKNRINAEIDGIVTAGVVNAHAQPGSIRAALQAPVTPDADVSLSQLLGKYLSNLHGEEAVRLKSIDKAAQHFGLFIECVGDKSAFAITKSDVDVFLDTLNHRKAPGRNTLLSATTKNDYLSSCKRVFKYGVSRIDGLDKNPFASDELKFKRRRGDQHKRLPFTRDELKRLFSQPTHTAGKFTHPYQYWIPLLALYTGARMNELCQLHVSDIVKSEIEVDGKPVWLLDINDNVPEKSVKNGNSHTVPLHPFLVDFGFIKFVDHMKTRACEFKDEHGYNRLFRGLTFTDAAGYQKNCSRWFNGTEAEKQKGKLSFKQAVGIESDEAGRRDFHSFRHTLATELQNAGVSNEISYKITNHAINESAGAASNSAGAGYRHDASVEAKYNAICKLDFSDELAAVKPFFEVCNRNRLRNKITAAGPKGL